MTVVLFAVGTALAVAAPHGRAQAPALVEQGQRAFMNQGCYGCHTVGKVGTPIGPDLSHVGAKYSRTYLEQWVKDPSAQRPSAHMPKLELSEQQAKALADFLSSLR